MEPEVRLVQSLELTLPPGLIGMRTGVLEVFTTVVILPVLVFFAVSSSEIFESKAEFELSKVPTFSSKEFSLLLRPTIWVVSVICCSPTMIVEVLPGIRNQRARPIRANMGRSMTRVLSIR